MARERTRKMHIFVKAYDKYRIIEDEADLRKNGLSLSDYYIVGDCLKELSDIEDKSFVTFIESVARWFESNGFTVNKQVVNYEISL